MSEQITVLFTNIHRFHGINVDGVSEFWCPRENKEYCVTIERVDDRLIYLTLPNGFRLSFLPPGLSTNYVVVREGWRADDGIATLSKHPVRPPSTPILESAFTLEIKPKAMSYERLLFSLPRTLNGMLVERGYCSQELLFSFDGCPESPSAGDELSGKASFMLFNRNGTLRYFCTAFCVYNVTQNKNLTTQYGCGSVLAV